MRLISMSEKGGRYNCTKKIKPIFFFVFRIKRLTKRIIPVPVVRSFLFQSFGVMIEQRRIRFVLIYWLGVGVDYIRVRFELFELEEKGGGGG